ncbi:MULTISPECIES: SRPBCC family protein [Pseudoalteromonas]|uniref:SRPBCC family protein n=1 Tax=Pseudoalteromonas obscura TaxID=3048491 RepID=A0ABT7EPI6_9GAMM|nr:MULTISPECIES: SRPBCC family protein [Pseudoalteromonas]MBQ4834800.1 SRPBCC family protein [Pseudoalteromonas luteoviolacea]MDK2596900.1 SRPBCC family protein [Pseudoalteromonas sp. P94(2023)]
MNIATAIEINLDKDSVWKLLAEDFTSIQLWFPAVKKSYALKAHTQLEGASCAGRVCELSDKPNGLKAEETITNYDSANGTLSMKVEVKNAPKIFPVRSNDVTFTLTAVSTDRTLLSFQATPTLKAHGYLLYPLLKLGLTKSFKDLNKAFKAHCESVGVVQPA